MDLKGYTTVDEVGEDSQVRNVESFKPTTAAEEIEYLNKILAKIEKCEVKENSKGGKYKLENAISEKDTHSNDNCNNNAVNPITESCSVYVNTEHGNAECERKCIRNESRDKLELHTEKCSLNEIIDERNSNFDESDIEEYGLTCADDILTQAESQYSVIQDSKCGHVQNELSTEPNLIMANPSVTDLEGNSRQNSSCTQSNISSYAELEEKLEACSIESITLEALNENGSSELSSSTIGVTIMPVSCSAESSSVLESGHYSAKDTFDFISGEDISGSSNLDSVELEDVSTLSNVVLGDIGSLLKSSADHANVTEENTAAYCETQVDLSLVKSEPVCSDPGEEFDLKEFCSDPAEEFVLKEHSIKEEPLDYSPPPPTINQEEVLLPVKIFKSEDDSDEQIITPNIRYLVENHKQYTREEVAAALIISQSSLSPIIDMEMFQNLGRTKLAVTLSRLENMIQCPKQLALEDFSVIQLFKSNYGTSIQDWKKFFNFKANYSVKHTGKRNVKKHISNVLPDKRKGKKGRKKKILTEKSNSNAKSNISTFKTEKVKDEVSEEIERDDAQLKHINDKFNNAYSIPKEALQLNEDAGDESSCEFEKSSELEAESKPLMEDSVHNKKRKRTLDQSDLSNAEVRSNELSIKDEDKLRPQCAELSSLHTLQKENNHNNFGVCHQLNVTVKACSIHLYDIANDPIYGKIVRHYLKNNESSMDLGDSIEEPLKESSEENEISPPVLEKDDDSDEGDNSFTGFSPVKLKEEISFQLKDEKDLATTIEKVDFVEEMQQNTLLKEENDNEISEPDEASMGKEEISEISYCRKNMNIEKGKEMEKEDATEIKLEKEIDIGIQLEKGDEFQKEKDERRTRKRLKLETEDVDAEMRNHPKDRKKIILENDLRKGKSETDQEKEGSNLKYDNRKKDGLMGVADFKKNKEDILTNKERNPIASSLSSLSTFKIPKKKVTHVLEHKTQQNSVLHRRGESPVTQKSDRYSSNKHFSVQSKRDCKERESVSVRNMKKERKPVIPAYTQPPVVEGWAKRAPSPFQSGIYPQAGFLNLHVRNKCPPIVHPGPGNTKAHLETVNQIRMHSGPHMKHVRPPVIAKAEYSNLPSSNYGVANKEKPVKQISISVNIPPPPPLEKLDLSSPKYGQGSGNIQSLPCEPSPVMSYGNSSDGESDVIEVCKTNLTSAQTPQINMTDTPNIDITEMCKASLSSALSLVTNVIGTPDIDVTEMRKASSCSAQPPLTNMADTPSINISTSVTDTPGEVLSKAKQELHLKMATAHEESSKHKVDTTDGASKDHYQHLDKKQKIKLYEKRKRYYYESKKRYHAEKGEKKKVWCKEYEKRRKEYYHLKNYLYKEKKKEYMENKLLRKSLETHSNDENRTSEVLKEDSELCDETKTSEQTEASSNTAIEAEEIPYSPTASPIDYDEEFYSINVQASLLDDAPRKQTVDEKDQKGSTLLNYPTEKLKEMIMQVMNTLNQNSFDAKCHSQNQSADSEVKSEDCESKVDADKSQPLNSTSCVSAVAKTSESLPAPSTSLPLPLQQTPMTMPPVTVSSTLDKTPLPVPPPSLTSLSLPPLVSSKAALKDSVLTTPVSSVAVSSTSNQDLTYERSSSYLKNISSPKTVSTAELPLSAPLVKSPMVEKSHLEDQTEPSVPTSIPQSNISLPPLPTSPTIPVPGKEFATEFTRSAQENSEHLSFPHGDVFPPLPSSPPPPPPEEEMAEKISGSVDENKDRLHEPNDDMTEVPMDIDSDSETDDCHDNDDNTKSNCHDNVRDDCHDGIRDGNVLSESYDNDSEDNEISNCHNSNKEGIEVASCHNNDKDFLALFGISENKLPSLEKEAAEDSINNTNMAKLLKKLMNVNNTNKPLETIQNECRPHAGKKEVTTNLTVDKSSSCLHLATHNQELVECNPLREQNTPSVSSKAVSPAQTKDIMEMGSKAREAEKISVSSYKQDEKGISCDGKQNAGCKSEIEIIGMKEPPKNLICVDELLMSVEAADQPPDLQIIYTDLRREPRDRKNIIRDEVPKYYQKTALAQMLVDKCKDIPLVGLQYVLEVRKDFDMTLDGCYYICAVCSKKMTAHTLVAHIKSVPHRLKFSETHCKHIHDKYGSYELKEWTASLVKEFTMDLAEIEKKMGRHKLAVAFERDISSVLKSLKQKISDINNLSQLQEEKTKVSVGQTRSSVASIAKNVSQPDTPVVDVKEVPLPEFPTPKTTEASVLSNKDIPLPSKSPGTKGENITNKNRDDDDDEEEEEEEEEEEDEEDIILIADTKNAANAKKFSSNGQGFTKRKYRPGPNARRRSSSGSTTPTLSPRKTWSRSRSRSKSKSLSPKRNISPSNKQMKHSRSPPRRKPDRPSYTGGRKRRHSRSPVSPRRHSRSRSGSRDVRKRYRTRSRSRSRHRSPYRRKDNWLRRSTPPRREPSEERARRVARRKLEDFREAETRIKARHKNQQIVYEKTPESHPLYNREWKIFWERRCRELEKDGVDPFLHDFKSEWARFWHHRMKELMEISFKNKRDSLLRKLRLDDPDLEENRKSSKPPSSSWRPDGENVGKISRIDRSPSPWEQDEGAPVIARNPSPVPVEPANSIETKGSSKCNEISTSKFEDDFSVIGTLKLLNELEDQLGSFGPAISTLLGKAVDCSQKGEDTLELFKDPDNLVLVRYAREKLSSQISAGILGVTALVRTQMAVERSMWLQSQAEKLANEGKYLGLDIAGIARATLGRDTVQIAQYIAQHLLQVGKSNASEADLQNILYAVLAAHTKLLVETSKKTQVDTPVVESATPVSTDPPKELPSAPKETSEGTKQPLFPSTVADDTSEGDKRVDDEDDDDSSAKLGGGLSLLQNAYEEENGKEMENLSLEDLRSLLANFSSLNPEEKQALTTYLKKLEATDSKKVMKLREEIQKSAKNAAKTGNVKSSLKSGKSLIRSQSVPNTDSNNQVSQEQPLEAPQASTPGKKYCPEKPPSHTSDDRSTRPHSMENVNQPARVPQEDRFVSGSEIDAIHVSRDILGPSASLERPTHNMTPAPCGMSEMAQDYGPNIGHKPDHRPHHIDQPMFEDGRNRSFPQRPFIERQEPGFGMSEPFKHNISNHDRNFDHFGYEPVQGQSNPVGPQNFGRYDRPPEFNNPHWQGFGRGGSHMDDRAFPPRDERNYNWFDEGPQPPYEYPDFDPRSRPEYPFRGGPHRGHHPNIRQPYREPW